MELRQLFSVLLVFVLLGGALVLLRRGSLASLHLGWFRLASPVAGSKPRTKALVSLERIALTPQHSLHLVRIQGREVVVATHPQGCELLNEAPLPSAMPLPSETPRTGETEGCRS
jgi:flagellar biogenesis protein FliO